MAQISSGMDAAVTGIAEFGLRVISLVRRGCTEHFVTAAALQDEAPRDVVARALRAVRDRDAQIVSLEMLGLSLSGDIGEAVGEMAFPITTLGAPGVHAGGGVQIWAVHGPAVTMLHSRNRTVGAVFTDAYANYGRVGGVIPSDITAPRDAQVAEALEEMSSVLTSAGLEFGNTVRTWFYNRDILDWYTDFNRARDQFFSESNIFAGLIPASTGTGGGNPQGAALSTGLIAVGPHDKGVRIRAVPSPLQCAALEYGSSFSRAVEVELPDHRRLFVSGTASIDQNGETAFLDDFEAQVDLTFQIVRAILVSREMDWTNISRGIAYVKRAGDIPAFEAFRACAGLADLPLVVVNADICRDDLLFELEVDAITANTKHGTRFV